MLQTPLLSATAYLAILASLVCSSPVAPNNLPKARIVSFQSNHAVARNSEDFSYSKLVERDFNRIQRFKERTQEWMPTKTVKQGRSVSAAEPFDIGPLRRSRKRKTWAQDPLLNNGHDTLYYGNLTVGSSEPEQQITMNFDTGSSDLLVPTQNCTRCPGPWFNPFGSTTFVKSKKRRTKWYGDGSFASGYISTDTVSLGSLSVPNQTFILVDEASPGFAGPNTGVIGLAFQPIATTAAKPWFIGLADQGALESDVFSFYFSRQGVKEGSELCVGCVDSNKYVKGLGIEYFPVTPGVRATQRSWTIEIKGLAYNGTAITTKPMIGNIDTGTALIWLPQAEARALYNAIPDAQPLDQGGWMLPCTKAGSIGGEVGIVFQGSERVFNILPSQFNPEKVDGKDGMCKGVVRAWRNENETSALIGDAFLTSWYTVFDYGNMRIGFAHPV